MVVSHAEGCRVDSRQRLHRFILYAKALRGTALESVGYDQLIGSTFSDAIVRSRLISTATGVVHWATSVAVHQIDN